MRFWDGTRLPATTGGARPSRCARRAPPPTRCARPGQLGLGRAYVSGELEVDDIDAAIGLLDGWQPPSLDGADKRALALAAVRAAGLTMPPPRPAAELVPSGRRHSKERDARAVRHHYDVSNEFFALFLDESMTYSCAIFSQSGAKTLEEAQVAKLDTVARKLAIEPGERVLDVGCGWGSFSIRAAKEYGANVVGITLSAPQAEEARRRAEAAGVGDRVEIRVMDYRDLVGEQLRRDLLDRDGGARRRGPDRRVRADPRRRCSSRAAGCSTTRSPGSATPTARPATSPSATSSPTPRRSTSRGCCWRSSGRASRSTTSRTSGWTTPRRSATGPSASTQNLERATQLAGPERMRVWRLYLRAARNGFEKKFTSIYQARCELS